MKVLLDNIYLNSSSGPNHFGRKLKSGLESMGHVCEIDSQKPDVQLSFIETYMQQPIAPMVLRLDGIYFDIETDFMIKNQNIFRSYNMASAVIFQSDYSKDLVFKYFGVHKNYDVVHNGADLDLIDKIVPMKNNFTKSYDNIWTSASSWYYGNDHNRPRRWKRLKENIDFFLLYSSPKDCMIVAGDVHQKDMINHDRIFYVGKLELQELYSLYKASKFFVHLASPDACPNVVVDARACGCKVICSSLGGAKEIAGLDALVVQEDNWDYNPMDLNGPRPLDLTKICTNSTESIMDMNFVAKKYEKILNGVKK